MTLYAKSRMKHPRVAPVLWYEIIAETNHINEETTWGLANIWGCIKRDDLEGARAILERIYEDWPHLRIDHKY